MQIAVSQVIADDEIERGRGMLVRIERKGEDLRVALPVEMASAIQVEAGSYVDLNLIDGQIVLTPVKPEDMPLAELVAGITPENRHGEIGWGRARGNEAW